MAKEQWEAWWTFTPLAINQAEVSCGWGGPTVTSTWFLMCCCLGTISRTDNPALKQVADPGKLPDWNCCAFPFVIYIFAWWVALKSGWPGLFCGSGKDHMTKLLFLISETCPITWPTMEPGEGGLEVQVPLCHPDLLPEAEVPWMTTGQAQSACHGTPRQRNSPCLGCLWQHSADLPSKWALLPFLLNNHFRRLGRPEVQ